MINAIGPVTRTNSNSSGTFTSGLESRIAQYQMALSNRVHIDSANMREDKEKIQTISSKLSAAKARLESIVAEKSNSQPTKLKSEEITSSMDVPASGKKDKIGTKSASASKLADTTIGRHVDVFA